MADMKLDPEHSSDKADIEREREGERVKANGDHFCGHLKMVETTL